MELSKSSCKTYRNKGREQTKKNVNLSAVCRTDKIATHMYMCQPSIDSSSTEDPRTQR